MPWWKFVANRCLTGVENLLLGANLSEYHTGYRAFSRELLQRVAFDRNSNDFVFDNEILAQIHWLGYTIAEVTCPTKYFKEASSINFRRSCVYGLGCLGVGLRYRLAKMGLTSSSAFEPCVTSHLPDGGRVEDDRNPQPARSLISMKSGGGLA